MTCGALIQAKIPHFYIFELKKEKKRTILSVTEDKFNGDE